MPDGQKVMGDMDFSQYEFKGIPHNQIKPYEKQPRTFFSENDIAELAESIDGREQTTPILVTLVPGDEQFTLIGGERRWRATSLLAKRDNIVILMKAVITPYKGEEELFRSACMDNLHRQDMHPLDIAAAFSRLRSMGDTQEEIATMHGKSVAFVINYLRLNGLDERVKAYMHPDRPRSQRLRVTHAIEIAKVEDAELQYELADEVIERRSTVAEVQQAAVFKAAEKGISVQQLRGNHVGRGKKPSDVYRAISSFLNTTSRWFNRFTDVNVLTDLYAYREDGVSDRARDLEEIECIIEKLQTWRNVLKQQQTGGVHEVADE